ncbi:MAG: DUF1501 domain-containing protein [Bryobacteraceae bacterium]|nr:DUF1501 domain-containing protein [Bryobacteraceae bacterium]
MTIEDRIELYRTRRFFFRDCGVGLGRIALGSLLAQTAPSAPRNPMAARQPHFPAKAKSVIYLFMAGGPSQLDMFDYKPALKKYDGQKPPESLMKGKKFAFMERMANQKMMASPWQFSQHGQSGSWVSELLPAIGGVADDIAIVTTMKTENFNHAPAKVFAHTGSIVPGRPSIGAWIAYGLGSESESLPGFVSLQSGPRGPRNGPLIWGSGFLPSAYQGVPFLPGSEPIFNLKSQPGVTPERQERALAALRALNEKRYEETGDDEIATRIAAYETAFRMQTSGPELMHLEGESKATLEMYGAEPGKNSFANNCLLARRLVERGVRCVQVYHTDWDHHSNIVNNLKRVTREVDKPSAALVRDLKQRGLLDQTLVVWGGEFGRTPISDGEPGTPNIGRNHHIDAYATWLAGGGIKGGRTVGLTDDIGFNPVEDRVHVHDLHATILHQLGMDHTKLTFRFQGRDFRLTDVAGNVVRKLIA